MVIPDNAIMSGDAIHVNAGIARSRMAQVANSVFPVPVSACRIWDSWLPLTAAANTDDVGCVAGTWGTDVPHLESSDTGETSVTQYWGWECTLPDNYDGAQSITVRIPAVMAIVIDTTATLDLECYLSDGNAAKSGSDICATAAQSINSAAWANYDFTITATSRTAGDKLFFRAVLALVDSGTVAAGVTAKIGDIEMLIDIRG